MKTLTKIGFYIEKTLVIIGFYFIVIKVLLKMITNEAMKPFK